MLETLKNVFLWFSVLQSKRTRHGLKDLFKCGTSWCDFII